MHSWQEFHRNHPFSAHHFRGHSLDWSHDWWCEPWSPDYLSVCQASLPVFPLYLEFCGGIPRSHKYPSTSIVSAQWWFSVSITLSTFTSGHSHANRSLLIYTDSLCVSQGSPEKENIHLSINHLLRNVLYGIGPWDNGDWGIPHLPSAGWRPRKASGIVWRPEIQGSYDIIDSCPSLKTWEPKSQGGQDKRAQLQQSGRERANPTFLYLFLLFRPSMN